MLAALEHYLRDPDAAVGGKGPAERG